MDRATKKYNEFKGTHNLTYKEICAALQSEDYKEFRGACNWLLEEQHQGDSHGDSYPFSYMEEIKLRDLANSIIRSHWEPTVVELYDKIIDESRKELYGGDELYKLYAYSFKPYNVTTCLKSTLSVLALMAKGINTIDDAILVGNLIRNTLVSKIYEDPYGKPDSVRQQIQVMEMETWENIAKLLFKQKTSEAFDYMQNRLRSKYAAAYGDNFHSIALDKWPKTA